MKLLQFKAYRQPALTASCAALLFLIFHSAAQAACVMTTSAATLDLGQSAFSALTASNLPGFKKVGLRQVVVNGSCDRSQTKLRLAFDGLQSTPGKSLVRWGTDGALIFRIDRVSVGSVDVPVALAGASAAGFSNSVVLTEDSVLDADLSRLPAEARKSFSVYVSVTALVPNSFVPRGQARFDNKFLVRLLDAN